MKNKLTVYFLGVAVCLIWGIIIYRVIDATKGDDDQVPVLHAAPKVKEAFNDFDLGKDTVKLRVNYRDPFGLVKRKDTLTVISEKAAVVKKIKPVLQPADWSFIHYSGYVRNPQTKKLIAMVTINGQGESLTEGQSRGPVKLIKNLYDSIKVSYKGKVKFIKMN